MICPNRRWFHADGHGVHTRFMRNCMWEPWHLWHYLLVTHRLCKATFSRVVLRRLPHFFRCLLSYMNVSWKHNNHHYDCTWLSPIKYRLSWMLRHWRWEECVGQPLQVSDYLPQSSHIHDYVHSLHCTHRRPAARTSCTRVHPDWRMSVDKRHRTRVCDLC
jgi:hypothetical protein